MRNREFLTLAAGYLNCAYEIGLYNHVNIMLDARASLTESGRRLTPVRAKAVARVTLTSLACEYAIKGMLSTRINKHLTDELFGALESEDATAHAAIKKEVMGRMGLSEGEFRRKLEVCSNNFTLFRYYPQEEGLSREWGRLDPDGTRRSEQAFVRTLTEAVLDYSGMGDLIESRQPEYEKLMAEEEAKAGLALGLNPADSHAGD